MSENSDAVCRGENCSLIVEIRTAIKGLSYSILANTKLTYAIVLFLLANGLIGYFYVGTVKDALTSYIITSTQLNTSQTKDISNNTEMFKILAADIKSMQKSLEAINININTIVTEREARISHSGNIANRRINTGD